MQLLHSPLLSTPHAFSTRHGGVSQRAFASLNLSVATGDQPQHVQHNQQLFLAHFNHPPVAALNQVHSSTVWVVQQSGVWQGDGLITQTPGLLLRVGVADCYPLLLHDPVNPTVAALHAGWRGVVGGILPNALQQMQALGCHMANVRLAVGPGIGAQAFQVGPEVAQAFAEAGLPTFVPDSTEGKFKLDLLAALRQQALQAGLQEQHLWQAGLCTYQDARFFSHRRDQGVTGRMWGAIMLKAN